MKAGKKILRKNWLVYNLHDRALRKAASSYLSGRLIDIGCGGKPFRELLKPFISEHVGVDIEDSPHDKSNIDLIGSAYDIPVNDCSFDCAICTAVLEHLEEPGAAIREACRVLKPGAYAIYTVPLFWHLHEAPRDFYRFTKFGLEYLFKNNGFDIVELNPLAGFWVTFGQELVYYMWGFIDEKKSLRSYVIPVLGTLIQAASYVLNKIDSRDDFTWMYLVVVRKRHYSGEGTA